MTTFIHRHLVLFAVIGVLVLAVFILEPWRLSTRPSPSRFDSKLWKVGDPSSRGAMVQDLTDRGLLIGKTRVEVIELLGQPNGCGIFDGVSVAQNASCDDPKVDWFGYRVVTISRCYFWICRMNVNFSTDSYRVEELTVSD